MPQAAPTAELVAALLAALAVDRAVKRVAPWRGAPSAGRWLQVHRVLNRRPALWPGSTSRAALLWAACLAAALSTLDVGGPLAGPSARLGLGAALGGAASNLLDAVRWGGVVDVLCWRGRRVFNVADLAIVAGLAAVALSGALGLVAGTEGR